MSQDAPYPTTENILRVLTAVPRSLPELRSKYAARLAAAEVTPGGAGIATVLRTLVDDLDAVECAHAGEMLTGRQARLETGYSDKQLKRQAASGEINAQGKGRQRRYERGSLKRKPGFTPPSPPAAVARAAGAGYDPLADARRLARQLASNRGGN